MHSFDMHSYHTSGTCEYISSICNINWKSNKQKAMNLMIIYIYILIKISSLNQELMCGPMICRVCTTI